MDEKEAKRIKAEEQYYPITKSFYKDKEYHGACFYLEAIKKAEVLEGAITALKMARSDIDPISEIDAKRECFRALAQYRKEK